MDFFDRVAERTDRLDLRALMHHVKPQWYVETCDDSEGNYQCGWVEKVFKDRYKIPVCLKIRSRDDNKIDYIPIDRVWNYEPHDDERLYDYSMDDYMTWEEIKKEYEGDGWIWVEDEEEGEYWFDPETGRKVCW